MKSAGKNMNANTYTVIIVGGKHDGMRTFRDISGRDYETSMVFIEPRPLFPVRDDPYDTSPSVIRTEYRLYKVNREYSIAFPHSMSIGEALGRLVSRYPKKRKPRLKKFNPSISNIPYPWL